MDGESRASDFRDASFAYLTAAQQNYVFKLTEPAQVSHPDIISSLVPTNLNLQLERPVKTEEGEISVFGAEQYFNMKLDDGNGGFVDNNAENFMHPTDQKKGDVVRMRSSKGRFGTPSVSSVSSWNSQSALLPSIRRNLSHTSQRKKANERWFFPGFACSRSCSDDKSIIVDENVARRGHQASRRPPKLEPKKLVQSRFQPKDEFGKVSIGTKREDYLVLPTVNSGVVHSLAKKREKKKSLEVEDPRISLEVFGTHVIKKEDIASNLERKLSVLTWDAIPFSKAQSLPRTNSLTYEEEDPGLDSDASSDLFEIENMSVSTQPIYTKNISGEMNGCMTPTSERSVEWSVATASAADFSFVSNYDQEKNNNTSSTPRNRKPNGFLGCTSQKSVNVVETVAYKRNEKPKPMPTPTPTLHQHPVRKLSADHSIYG